MRASFFALLLLCGCTATSPGVAPFPKSDLGTGIDLDGGIGHLDLGKMGILGGPPDGATVSNHSGNTIDGGTCTGGCFMGTTCTMANNASACGTTGAACQVCPSGSTCTGGSCKGPCSATSCKNGCCDSTGSCVAVGGQNSNKCGIQGESCSACDPDQSCTAGICTDPPPTECQISCPNGCCDSAGNCLAGSSNDHCGSDGDWCVQCGGSFECKQQECFVVPGSTWDLYVDQAQVSLVDNNGDYWDAFNGLPDPYLVVATGTGQDLMTAQTYYQPDTTSPVWGPEMGGLMLLGNLRASIVQQVGMTFTFYDHNEVLANEFMGKCTFAISDYDFSAPSIERACGFDKPTKNTGFVIDFHFVPHF